MFNSSSRNCSILTNVAVMLVLALANLASAQSVPAPESLPALRLPQWDETLPPVEPPSTALPFRGVSPVGAPVISEWNRFQVLPNESFTLTGTLFTAESAELAASDTIVWIWTNSAEGGRLAQCKVWSVTSDNILMASVPDDFPVGPYIVWVQNKNGFSAPILLNQCEALWIGPLGDSVPSGEVSTKRVFGRNLHVPGTEASPSVFLAKPDGTTTALRVLSWNAYAVEVEIPADIAAGSYSIRVHNGLHGLLGWSRSLPLEAAPKWTRGDFEVVLKADTEDDRTRDLQAAIDQVSSQPNGGTVRLEEGVFRVSSKVIMKSRVRLQGAGPDKTTILGTGGPKTYTTGDKIEMRAPSRYIAFEDLTLRSAPGTTFFGIGTQYNPGNWAEDVLIRNVHFRVGEDSTSHLDCRIAGRRVEVTECIFEGKLMGSTSDYWIHKNQFFGARWAVGKDGAMEFQPMEKDLQSGRFIIENCAAETRSWPRSESGSRNYLEFTSEQDREPWVWCARLVHFALHRGSFKYSYIANNKTRDVAIDDNKGEIILFHSSSSNLYGRVLKNEGRTLTIATDGVIRGIRDFSTERSTENYILPMKSVSEKLVHGRLDNGGNVIIVDGRGVGQSRVVESSTSDTITVKEPWIVEPDETSVFVLGYLYKDHVVYKNDLQGVPEGWAETKHIASSGVQFDGNIFRCVADSNANRRTYYGDALMAYGTAPSFWSEFRNSRSTEGVKFGMSFNAIGIGNAWSQTPNLSSPGFLLVGNWIRGGDTDTEAGFKDVVRLRGSYPAPNPYSAGNGIENVAVKKQILASSFAASQLIRNNRATGDAFLTLNDFSDPILIENSGFTLSGGIFNQSLRNAMDPAPFWGGRMTTSSTQEGSHPSRSTDDDLESEWVASGRDPGWLIADLGFVSNVSEVELVWRDTSSRTLKYEVSLNAEAWETVLEDQVVGESSTANLENKPVRYIRVSFDLQSRWPKLREFRVMGTKPGSKELVNLLRLPPWSAPLPTLPCVFVRGSGELSIPIANPGVANLEWKVAGTSVAWLSAAATVPDVPSQQTSGRLTVQTKAAGLPPGLHRGTVIVENLFGERRSVGVLLDTTP